MKLGNAANVGDYLKSFVPHVLKLKMAPIKWKTSMYFLCGKPSLWKSLCTSLNRGKINKHKGKFNLFLKQRKIKHFLTLRGKQMYHILLQFVVKTLYNFKVD